MSTNTELMALRVHIAQLATERERALTRIRRAEALLTDKPPKVLSALTTLRLELAGADLPQTDD